jgi:hypothetical protein
MNRSAGVSAGQGHRLAPTTQTLLPTGGKERKTRHDAVAVPGFKPIHAAFGPTLTVARDYTKRPEVTAGKPGRRGHCWRRFSFLCRRPVAADASATSRAEGDFGLRKCQVLRTRRPTGLDSSTLTALGTGVKEERSVAHPAPLERARGTRGASAAPGSAGSRPRMAWPRRRLDDWLNAVLRGYRRSKR